MKQHIIRRLLQLDKPVTILSAAEAKVEQERNFRWNLFFNSFDVIFFISGISLLSATTILPLFVSKLSDSTLPLALIAMLAQGGYYIPQLLTANFIERLDHKMPVVVNIGFFSERLPMILLMLCPLFALQTPLFSLFLFLLLYAWFNLGAGVIAPAWQDMIARCFPVERRGRFFGINTFIGTLLGVGAVSWAGMILEEVAFPLNFTYIFGLAGLFILISWVFIAQTREPIEAANVPERSTREYLAELPTLIRHDINFRNFLVARFTLALAEMGSGFLTIAAIQRWAISDSMVATFTTVTLVGQVSASLLMGFLADRYGHRLSLEISSGAAVLAFAIAWLAPTPTWYLAVFFLLGVLTGGRIISGILVVLEFCAPEKRPTYVGITNTLIGIASMAAPLIGLAFVTISYSSVFVASMLTSLAALLLLRYSVKEPRFA